MAILKTKSPLGHDVYYNNENNRVILCAPFGIRCMTMKHLWNENGKAIFQSMGDEGVALFLTNDGDADRFLAGEDVPYLKLVTKENAS